MPRLSLVVITLNEQDTIARCLDSVDIADEIIVVDSGSTDRTADIAEACGARVIVTADWPGFGPQKNRAIEAATGDWILSLDADEWLEPASVVEIEETITSADAADGYYIPRRSRFCGVVAKRGGWWPDYVLRLFRSGCGRFSDSLVHERVILEGLAARLSHPIEHRGVVDAADAERKIARYSVAAANEMMNNGRRSTGASASLHGTGAFMKSYLLKLGLLDGTTGWQLARYNARYTYRKWHLLHDLRSKLDPSAAPRV